MSWKLFTGGSLEKCVFNMQQKQLYIASKQTDHKYAMTTDGLFNEDIHLQQKKASMSDTEQVVLS